MSSSLIKVVAQLSPRRMGREQAWCLTLHADSDVSSRLLKLLVRLAAWLCYVSSSGACMWSLGMSTNLDHISLCCELLEWACVELEESVFFSFSRSTLGFRSCSRVASSVGCIATSLVSVACRRARLPSCLSRLPGAA